MKWFYWIQWLLPTQLISKLFGWLGNIRFPAFKNAYIKTFIRIYNIDMQPYQERNPGSYSHFNAFFTRAIRSETRPIASTDWISPADGKISAFGPVAQQQALQAKGFSYRIDALLGAKDSFSDAINGSYYTVYLAPYNYHRVHMPCSGKIVEKRVIPGRALSVSLGTVNTIPHIFTRNARHVCLCENDQGKRFAVVLVAALNVAAIHSAPVGSQLARGEELGKFEMGSTVVVLTEESIDFAAWTPEAEIFMGQAVG